MEEHIVTHEEATELMEHFEQKGYITSTGKVKDTMKNALKNGTLDLPQKYEAARERFEQIIANADRKPPVRDASRDDLVCHPLYHTPAPWSPFFTGAVSPFSHQPPR